MVSKQVRIFYIHLFPVFPYALPESLLAREPVVEGGDAAFVADHSTGNTLDPVAGVEALPSKVTTLDAARGRNEDVSSGRGSLAPVDCSKGIWRTRFGSVVRGELCDRDVPVAVPTGGWLRRALV